MIQITGDWFLTADVGNVILSQRKTNGNTGEDYFVDVAFPRDFEQLMNSLAKRKIRIGIEAADHLKELVALEKQIKADNAAFYKKFEKQIKQMLKEEREHGKNHGADQAVSGSGSEEGNC